MNFIYVFKSINTPSNGIFQGFFSAIKGILSKNTVDKVYSI